MFSINKSKKDSLSFDKIKSVEKSMMYNGVISQQKMNEFLSFVKKEYKLNDAEYEYIKEQSKNFVPKSESTKALDLVRKRSIERSQHYDSMNRDRLEGDLKNMKKNLDFTSTQSFDEYIKKYGKVLM